MTLAHDASYRMTANDTRVASNPADRAAVARLRFEVYVEEMGRQQVHADRAMRTIHEPADNEGIVLGTFTRDGRAIGTLRLNNAMADGIPFRELYGWEQRARDFPGQVYLASKLIVAPEHRGTLVSLELMRAGIPQVMARGWRFCYLDANRHLIALYKKLGFVALAQREHPMFGQVTIMEWDTYDLEHMRAVRSPLLREFLLTQSA
jgi:predicted GNAT family N-acyltransferase